MERTQPDERTRTHWGPLAALVFTLPALWPLLRAGFLVTDDGRFHVYRIAALADAWQHGVLYPRLFPDFGFGYGQAVLNYYAPLSYAPGALLSTAGISPVWAAKATIALGFVLAALAAYGFGRTIWGAWGGVLAAVAYTYFPYHLADAYVRGAIPEFMAFIWLPLILWATTSIATHRGPSAPNGTPNRVTNGAMIPALGAALAWAGLVLTHNLTALLMIPAAALYVVALGLWMGRWRSLLSGVFVSLALGALLSAPLWLPFFAESGQVGIALGPSQGYREHLAPLRDAVQSSALYRYRDASGGAADHPLPWTTVALIALVAGLTAWRMVKKLPIRASWLISYFLLLTVGSAFMATAPSLPLWIPLEPLLAHLQYPWRFLSLTGVGVMGLAAATPALLGLSADAPNPSALRLRQGLVALVGTILLVQPLLNVPATPLSITTAEAWAPDRMWREDAEAGQVGATWTGEFLPLTVTEQRWALSRPRDGATDSPALAPLPTVQIPERGYDSVALAITAGAPLSVRLHQFHLPAWRATLNGAPLPTYPDGALGLVTADIPAGAQRVAFQFGPTLSWRIGWVLCLIGALIWATLAWRAGRAGRTRWLRMAAVGLPLLVLILALNSEGLGQRRWTPTQPAGGQAALGDVALLIGRDAAPARGERALDVTLYWFALRETGTNYKSFVHLLGPDGQVIAQQDGDPGGGYTPTTRWMQGEITPDQHRLLLPEGLPAGTYGLRAGMYAVDASGAAVNLPVDPATPDGRVDLGTVEDGSP